MKSFVLNSLSFYICKYKVHINKRVNTKLQILTNNLGRRFIYIVECSKLIFIAFSLLLSVTIINPENLTPVC